MNTTFIIKLSFRNEDLIEPVGDTLYDADYGETEAYPLDADRAYTVLMHQDSDEENIIKELRKAVTDDGIEDDFDAAVIRVWQDNADEWKDCYNLDDYDDGVINAVTGNDSSFLANPENIKGYIDENYIGEFNDESDMARHLADEDPDIQSLDDRIVNCMDLTEYYSDEMRFDMWHDGPYWFWDN